MRWKIHFRRTVMFLLDPAATKTGTATEHMAAAVVKTKLLAEREVGEAI